MDVTYFALIENYKFLIAISVLFALNLTYRVVVSG